MRSIQKITKKYHAENVSNFSVSSSCKIQNLTDINAYTLHVSGSGRLFVIKSTLVLTYSALYLGSSKLLDLVIYSFDWTLIRCWLYIFQGIIYHSLYSRNQCHCHGRILPIGFSCYNCLRCPNLFHDSWQQHVKFETT